jgi:hypothetical protein
VPDFMALRIVDLAFPVAFAAVPRVYRMGLRPASFDLLRNVLWRFVL